MKSVKESILNIQRWLPASFLVMIGLFNNKSYAFSYVYEKSNIHQQIVHVLTINPKDYQVQLVRANNGSGRETVPAIAKRTGAAIAINGGFFKINSDGGQDGMPTGTLIIKGQVYHRINKVQPLILIEHNQLSIIKGNPIQFISKNTSMVSGVPLLVNHGEIAVNFSNKKSDFYRMPHARTALGVKADGSIVIVVAEHHYQLNLTEIALGGFKQTLSNKALVRQEGQGFTIVELARFMKSLGCQYAINLDGGGSSTLYINGKVVNQTIGDVDEGNAFKIVRPVSDAIVFIKH